MNRSFLALLLVVLMLFALAGCDDASPVLAGTPTPAATPTPLPRASGPTPVGPKKPRATMS